MDLGIPPLAIERRKTRRDAMTLMLKGCSVLSVATLVAGFFLLAAAQPESFFAWDAHLGMRTTWDGRMLSYLFYLLLFGLVVAGAGLIANSRRLKRSSDWVRINLVVLWAASVVGIVAYSMM